MHILQFNIGAFRIISKLYGQASECQGIERNVNKPYFYNRLNFNKLKKSIEVRVNN
ncbi:hypothetical protein LLB_3250 [Legionella longbeachae D-4968]|nr:hypothetical protein LLB_3250 [Legionella longbeachae D-4968]